MKIRAKATTYEDQQAYNDIVNFCFRYGIVLLTTQHSDHTIELEFIDNGSEGYGLIKNFIEQRHEQLV